jgi:hypothetical protein
LGRRSRERQKQPSQREHPREQASQGDRDGLVLIAPAPDFTEELMWKG